MSNRTNTVIYTGVTSNLEGRVLQHKALKVEGFTKRYRVTKLVYYEEFNSPIQAIAREKQIKGWNRSRKNALVFSQNLKWDDLAKEWKDPSQNSG